MSFAHNLGQWLIMPLAFNQNGFKLMAVLKNLQQENELLRAQLAAAKQTASAAIRLKVAKSGGVSLYGMGRWPTTLYRTQWETLLSHADTIRQFLEDHSHELSSKDDKD